MNIFDRAMLQQRRQRVRKNLADYDFLYQHALAQIQDRLAGVKRSLENITIVDDWGNISDNQFTHVTINQHEIVEGVGVQDAVISFMTMQQLNDPVGHLIQLRKLLKPDGLMLAVFLGGKSFQELDQLLRQIEVEHTGGISPRVAPTIALDDAAGLLQRSGYALPVAESEIVDVTYSSLEKYLHDLRGMALTNILSQQSRKILPKGFFEQANQQFNNKVELELFFLTGWSPDDSQPKPLKRGSGQMPLSDALNG